MGTGAKTEHTPYTVSPTEAEPVTELPEADPDALLVHAKVLIEDLSEGPLAQGPYSHEGTDDPLTYWYDPFAEAVQEAAKSLDAAAACGADPDAIAQARQDLQAVCAAQLTTLDPESLQHLAAAQGWDYPQLLGPASGDGPHPLAVLLDPTVADHAKAAIQAKAVDRYNALCSGETYQGLTLADVMAASFPPPETGGWPATKEEINGLVTTIEAQIAAYESAETPAEREQAVAQMVTAENYLRSALCLEAGDMPAIKSSTTNQIQALIAKNPDEFLQHIGPAVQAAAAAGLVDPEEAAFASPSARLRMIRLSTDPHTAEFIKKQAEERANKFKVFLSAENSVKSGLSADGQHLTLPALSSKEGAGKLAEFTYKTKLYVELAPDIQAWQAKIPDNPELAEHSKLVGSAQAVTKAFKQWAKDQTPTQLRQMAHQLGLEYAYTATKAQARDYIAASWDPAIDSSEIQDYLQLKAQPSPPPASQAAPKKAAQPSPTSTPAPAPASTAAPGNGFAAKHAAVVASLRQAKAAATDIPPWQKAETVQSWDFGSGSSAASLGGMHSKSLHAGPDGGQWLFKPDKSAGGARADAEAAASATFHAAGLPSVPVYRVNVGGKAGAIQPMLKGATQLPSQPKHWTQADVDSMVRLHVAAWLVGDHDGKHDNMLRTQTGGLVPIDQGQAFKFYGQDKLDLSYHPNAAFGAGKPVFHLAYEAHTAGGLAEGVTINPAVAHPVIKKFESIPDTEWRQMLHDTAHNGAANNVHWVPAMRKRAAKQHGIPAAKVTHEQVAEAFLDHACERKNGLRAAFAGFFTKQVGLPSGSALLHGN